MPTPRQVSQPFLEFVNLFRVPSSRRDFEISCFADRASLPKIDISPMQIKERHKIQD